MGGEGSEGKYCNFPYRKSFTPDLNVFPLCESYYFILHFLHHPYIELMLYYNKTPKQLMLF